MEFPKAFLIKQLYLVAGEYLFKFKDKSSYDPKYKKYHNAFLDIIHAIKLLEKE